MDQGVDRQPLSRHYERGGQRRGGMARRVGWPGRRAVFSGRVFARVSGGFSVSVRTDVAEMLHEQVEYRELLYQMTRRDLLLRYKQTIMGFAWAVFTPLLNTIIFSVVFTRVAPINVGVPYPVFSYTGLLAWNFFASSLRLLVNSLTSN